MAQNKPYMANDRQDEETGRFQRAFDAEDYLAAIDACGGLAGTSDVAKELDAAKRTVLKNLNDLADEGLVEKRRIGGRTIVWVLPDEALAPEESS